ncbi:MAG: HAMP domain-containing sensor histidine kinase [Candidatus Paceibacterota bacterium]
MPNCEVIEDSLYTYYYYFIGLLSFVWILIFSFHKYFKTKIKEEKQQIFYLTFGMSAFLISFFIAGFFASYFDNFNLEQYGLFGMVVFIAYLAFLIVKFKAFDIKLIGSQALVWALIVLVGSEFFFVESLINQILVGATLIISSVSGLLIVRSVKREIALREHLEIANRNQESLIHFISHQLKGFFTKSKMIFSGIVEDDFGQTSYELKEAAKEGLLSDDNAVSMIQDILGASNLKKGTTTYNMKEIDFTQIVKKICSGFTKDVETKGLELKCNVPEIPMKILADSTQIDQVVKNLIDNSLKYTPKGSVEVSLGSEKKDGKDKVLLVIKDTGIGLSESDKNKLFTEGGKGDESLKVNVNSTGYGLYIVKKIVENHGGKIWAESDGRGMGSRFYVELGMIK